ncbi:hypothetical protein DFH08DRAFT_952787 [Mycena albidolilacea]|uniref:F-box domain-containing protein n=1 Tax=Mycena albidolilacea TaxID=1033008 RepID=A0AAD7F0B1_9AGAR|nr:hypothetical protein DFH08DRAFT_952787 [Mycena albidolilacea]
MLLPQELFDAIIDEIHDKETLKACALLSSAFLPPSQRNLFRKVQLGGHSRDISAPLAEFPHLVSYIRDLTIYVWDTASNFAAVPAVLRSVQNIESLAVFGRAVNWNRLGYEASSALLDCLSRPSLRRLDLKHVEGVPTAFILAATAIPVVSFEYVHMDLGGGISDHLRNSAPASRIRHLILNDGDPAVFAICDFLLHPRKNPAYTQQIERLEIRIDQHSVSQFERIMGACAATLKCLAVDATDLIRLPLLPSVLEVEIKVFIGDNRRLPLFFSSNLSQVASSLPLVETITLVFVVAPLPPEVRWPNVAPLPIFGPSFMDRTQLLHLRQVHCKLLRREHYSGDMRAVFDRFVPAMESRMPGLQGTGILKCSLAEGCGKA